MKNRIEFEAIAEFIFEATDLRKIFPEFAREIDRMVFEVGKNHVAQCGDAKCDCQTLTFEDFHRERNIMFGTTGEARAL